MNLRILLRLWMASAHEPHALTSCLFSMRVPPDAWREIPDILRAITPERLREMQAQLAAARVAYFENPMRTAVSLVWLRLQALGGNAPQAEGAASASSEGAELQLVRQSR